MLGKMGEEMKKWCRAVGSNTVLRFCFSPWFSVHGFVSGFLPMVA